jgi:tetratricopeptide (TPR) repeat protein
MRIPTVQFRILLLAVVFTALLTVGATLGVGRIRRPAPKLDGLDALLDNKRFDEVEKRLDDYLRFYPNNLQANMLMAQVALAREDQKPEVALRHLNRIKTRDRGTRALILLNEGKAYSALGRYDRAETAWKEALRVEPLVPEAGWALLGLYYVQGRRAAARRLAMPLFATEPDPRDRVQLLLELVRQDVQELAPESILPTFEPVVLAHPDDLYSSITLGVALIHNSRFEEGLSMLRGLVNRFATNADAWDALLLGLDEASQFNELATALARLPTELAADSRFERYRGTVAQDRRDWPAAVTAYLHAWQADPSDARVLFRLGQALRAAGRLREAEQLAPKIRAARQARSQVRALYEEANADKSLGITPHPDLYHRLADVRERMGRDDEALAWHRLALSDNPEDRVSKEASARLQATIQALAKIRP